MRRSGWIAAALVAVTGGLGLGWSEQAVTIHAYPSIVRWPDSTSLAGFVSSGRAGKFVAVESKTCGLRSFQTVASVRTTRGGAWVATEMSVNTKTVFRARWGGVRSREVVVLARPHLVLGQRSPRLFRAILLLGTNANGKRLLVQWFDRENRVWRIVRTVVFRSNSPGYPQMSFRATVPKRTLLRLMLPRAEARPCYLAGYSNLLRT